MPLAPLLLALAGLGFAADPPPPPDFTGVYQLDEKESPPRLGGLRQTVWRIDHRDPVFSYAVTGILGHSQPFRESVRFSTDGRLTGALGKGAVSGTVEDGAVVMRLISGGRTQATITLRLSQDGRRLIRESVFAGGRRFREVYNRVSAQAATP